MKKVLLILLLNTSAWAACPLFTYPENHKLDAEINNVCDNILNPAINYETVTKAVFNNISVSTITSVSSETVTNLTVVTKVTVPNGSAATDAAAFGQIPTNYQAAVQAVSTTDFSTTANTYQTSNLSASIIPSSSASRIKITVSGDIQIGATLGVNVFASLFRTTSTNLAVGTDTAFCHVRNEVASTDHAPCSFTFIDSPASTSSTQYLVRIKNDDGATAVHFGGGEDQVMILEEIK